MNLILFANNAATVLASGISNTATSVTLATGTGALFPSPGADQYFVATLNDALTGLVREIVWCTAVAGDVVTIERAQEGTTAQSWLAGDFFQNRVTAGQLATFAQFTGVTITDGTNIVDNATQLVVAGGVVGGTSPNATLTLNSERFTSAPQAVPSPGGLVTVAHGLGSAPLGYNLTLICTSADNGWSIGDTIAINPGPTSLSSGNVNGFQTYSDATNLYAILNIIGYVSALNKGSGVFVDLTLSKWNMIFNAWV